MAETRVPLILAAALEEFARNGFNATRIDDIANRAGLSKGGFYAHFASKEVLFEILLRRELSAPLLDVGRILDGTQDIRQVIKQLVEVLGTKLLEPKASIVMRLLLSDGWRLPGVMQPRYQQAMSSVLSEIESLLQQCVEGGLCKDGGLCRQPRFILSPFIHAMVQQLVPGGVETLVVDQMKQDLVEILEEVLYPDF